VCQPVFELPLNVANAVGHFETDGCVFDGAELLADVAFVVGGGDGAHDGGVVEFLALVDFVATGVTGRVEVADVLDVVAESTNDMPSMVCMTCYG
jgi:hypothetical protein